MTALVLGPVIIVIGASFKQPAQLFTVPPVIFPLHPTLSNYATLFSSTDFGTQIINSVVIGISVSLVAVMVGACAGYAIARIRFRLRALIRIGALVWYMFPAMLVIIPLYLEFNKVGLTNNDLGVAIAFLSFTIPFCMWMLTAFFHQLPKDIEDAAHIDGCTRFGAFWRIALPLAKPALGASFMAAFMMTWGDYLFSITLISNNQQMTVGAGLNSLVGEQGLAYGQLLAGTVLIFVVPIAILAVGRKWLMRGLVNGAVK
ncbi:MAG: carbohydrate ABC transporter permease [Acidimicrobiales bacterium]